MVSLASTRAVTGMALRSVILNRAVRAVVITAILVVASIQLWPKKDVLDVPEVVIETDVSSAESPSLPVPDEYTYQSTQSEFCIDRFTPKYFGILQQRRMDYCDTSMSASRMTCFHTPGDFHADGHVDSLCIGQNARFDKSTQKFLLDCKEPTDEPEVSLDSTMEYWSGTGVKPIVHDHVSFAKETSKSKDKSQPRAFTILLKREGSGNIFHCLIEMLSLMYTRDLLRMTRDPTTGEAYYKYPEDLANTRIVVLDEHDDGPYWQTWQMFSDHAPIRLAELDADAPIGDIIIPLAGLGNPVWNDDWESRGCVNEMRHAFTQQVLEHYGIRDDRDVLPPENLTLTIIERKKGRQLLALDDLVEATRQAYPDVKVQVVDWAALPFKEQLEIAHGTDIMVGVHGAGLTHGLFMKRNQCAMVEILSRESIRSFHAMAMENGLRYFRGHAKVAEAEADWHDETLTIDQDKFLMLVDHAVKSLHCRPGRFKEMWPAEEA